MSFLILQGDAANLPLPDASVDLIVTSPPYFALRSYRDGGEHYDGQIGSEATPAEFLEALWRCTAEWQRVLKPSGSMFVNLGDKYAGSRGHNTHGVGGGPSKLKSPARIDALHAIAKASRHNAPDRYNQASDGVRPKSLMGLPWRYAIGCIDGRAGDPLILRSEIVWCLSGGARVYARTPTGDRPIMLRDLVRHYRPENVKLWNGQRWTQVLGWNRSADTDGALELELRSGERIGCTPGHQWPTTRGLLRADEIRVGDVIDSTTIPEPDKPRQPSGLDDNEVGWLVGLYIAEGSRSGKMLQFAGHSNEVARHAQLARIAVMFDGRSHVYLDGENKATCNLSGAVLVGIIDRYVSAGTAHTKRLTTHAWQRSNRFLAAVMRGYLSGDGHYDGKNDRWRLGFTDNDELAADIRTLSARLGCSLTLKRATFTGFGKVWPGWRGEWRWVPTVEHWNARQRSEVVAIRASRARHFYDVGVEDEPHTFALASGVLSHNSKPNGMPESVTDRVRRSHEQFFHFTKQGSYYSAVDEIRESHADASIKRSQRAFNQPDEFSMGSPNTLDPEQMCNPLGKLPGSVWTVPTEPLVVSDAIREHYNLPDHFAAFPSEWPRRLILGWSPSGICIRCGDGRRPIVEKILDVDHNQQRTTSGWRDGTEPDSNGRGMNAKSATPVGSTVATIIGESCACLSADAPTRPAVILDPFSGTGTVAGVAHALGRVGIGVDLSHDYCRLARWFLKDGRRFSKAAARTDAERQGILL